MKVLVDECCPPNVVAGLREDGHDVVYVAEAAPSLADVDILKWSVSDGRIVVTEDRDFGELVFLNQLPAYGIVLVRISHTERETKATRVRHLFATRSADLPNAMTTITLNKIRIRPLPPRP